VVVETTTKKLRMTLNNVTLPVKATRDFITPDFGKLADFYLTYREQASGVMEHFGFSWFESHMRRIYGPDGSLAVFQEVNLIF